MRSFSRLPLVDAIRYFGMVTFASVLVKPRYYDSLVVFLKGPCTTATVDLNVVDRGVRSGE